MRTERPSAEGFDVYDPRLEGRRAAAQAQRTAEALDLAKGAPNDADEDWSWAPEPVGVGAKDPQ